MRNRKEITGDIEKLTRSLENMKSELAGLETSETDLFKRAGESILMGNDDQSHQVLLNVRTRKETLNYAIDLAGGKLTDAQTELRNLGYAEAAAKWAEFERGLWEKLERIQGAAGEAGINNQVEKLEETIKGARSQGLDKSVQDAALILDRFDFACVEMHRALYECWKRAEEVKNLLPGYQARHGTHSPGGTPGFGKH